MDADEPSTMVPATRSDLPAISLTLAKAFHDDPVMALLFGGTIPRDKATRFFSTMGNIQLEHGHVYRTPGTEAASVWAPPGEWKVPNSKIVKYAPALLRVFGYRLFGNLGILTTMEKNHPHEPHYYLEFIGTDPAAQGKGFGSALMQPMIDRCDAEGVGAYLESSKESNVAFYSRFGFTVTKTLTHKHDTPMWLMWRDPR